MKKSTPQSNIVKCPSCGRDFNIYGSGPTFRSCDAFVCSPQCSYVRVKSIASIDKNLDNPMSWPMQRSQSNSKLDKPIRSTTWCTNEEPFMIEEGNQMLKEHISYSIQINVQEDQIRQFDNDDDDAKRYTWPFACLLLFAVYTLVLA